jgi:hypothetical protein
MIIYIYILYTWESFLYTIHTHTHMRTHIKGYNFFLVPSKILGPEQLSLGFHIRYGSKIVPSSASRTSTSDVLMSTWEPGKVQLQDFLSCNVFSIFANICSETLSYSIFITLSWSSSRKSKKCLRRIEAWEPNCIASLKLVWKNHQTSNQGRTWDFETLGEL